MPERQLFARRIIKALEYIQEGIALAEEKQGNKKQEDKKQETLLQEMKYNEIICLEKTADWEMAKEKCQNIRRLIQRMNQ